MYIIKNAFKCIGRSKGRNILIGVIVLVIAVSACVGLSIRQAAEKAKSDTLDGLAVTAAISFDRRTIMNQVQSGAGQSEGGKFDKGQFTELMSAASALSLEDYEKYAEADSVKEFYYSETASVSGTYVFADADAYHKFEEEVRTLGLDEAYTVSSPDLAAYENSLTPLETLSKTAGWFLIVILVIGAIILIVLNIFNVRERKYEIGVLTAMGMSKGKVALQFLTEIFAVTLSAVIIGAAAGAVSSVPVTNALLQNQVESKTAQTQQIEQNFGRGGKMGTAAPIENTNYITEISRAADMTVIAEMLGIAILLTLISGAVSMLFIMRYELLKILANRD